MESRIHFSCMTFLYFLYNLSLYYNLLLLTVLLYSCINGGEEPLSALIAGGRHPGQYFLTGGESVDFLVNNDVRYYHRIVQVFMISLV